MSDSSSESREARNRELQSQLIDYPAATSARAAEVGSELVEQPIAALPETSSPLHPAASTTEVREETVIPLLEERLRVDYTRRKLGEVVVRKTIGTRMVQVPVRYERLHIEQISPEARQLAEVDLSQGNGSDLELTEGMAPEAVVTGEFASLRLASQVLYELGKTLQQCKRVRVEIELQDANLQDTYQEWIDNFPQQ